MTDIHELIGELNNILDETKNYHEDGKRNAYHTKEGMREMLAAVEELVDKCDNYRDALTFNLDERDGWIRSCRWLKQELQKLKETLNG